MTDTPTNPPPATVGTQPTNAAEVNMLLGTHLKGFVANKSAIGQDEDWLLTVDLKAAPYFFTAEQETLLKSAIHDLDAAFDGIDMTFISQIIGI